MTSNLSKCWGDGAWWPVAYGADGGQRPVAYGADGGQRIIERSRDFWGSRGITGRAAGSVQPCMDGLAVPPVRIRVYPQFNP